MIQTVTLKISSPDRFRKRFFTPRIRHRRRRIVRQNPELNSRLLLLTAEDQLEPAGLNVMVDCEALNPTLTKSPPRARHRIFPSVNYDICSRILLLLEHVGK